MKLTDLSPQLQLPYPNEQGFGVEKGKTPELKNIWFVIPRPPAKENPQKLSSAILRKANDVLNAIQRLDSLTGLDQLVLGLLLRREALQSSRMEGTFSTIDQVLTPASSIEKKQKSAQNSISAYAHVLESFFVKASTKGVQIFSEDLLRKVHIEVMSKDPNFRGKAGLFRDEVGKNNYATIGGLSRPESSIYNPTPPKYVQRCLKQNLDWMKDEEGLELSRAGMAPGFVVRLARGHSHFEAVHPFSDGNGRVGRTIMVLHMVTEGFAPLYISGFIEAHKKEYYQSLQLAQMKLQDAPLIHFICEALVESFHESENTKKALIGLQLQWAKRADFRKGSAALYSLPVLLETPILSVRLLQDRLKISQPAAKRAIDQLCAAKILNERTGFDRNRIFAAEEVIELLARPFGENPDHAIERAAKVTHFKKNSG